MSAIRENDTADPWLLVTDLRRQLEERTAERDEAVNQQAAAAEILGVINSSPGDLAPVFDAMLDRATRLCGAQMGALWTYDGQSMHAEVVRGAPPQYAEFLKQGPHPPARDNSGCLTARVSSTPPISPRARAIAWAIR
jgi:hypothetical protein